MGKHLPSTQKIDLCFIDGSHTYRGAIGDIRAFLPHCKYLMMHDIVDWTAGGVKTAWLDVTKNFPVKNAFTCTEQPEGVERNVLGIGVLQVNYGKAAFNGTV